MELYAYQQALRLSHTKRETRSFAGVNLFADVLSIGMVNTGYYVPCCVLQVFVSAKRRKQCVQ
jgi:hypothetical protein